MNKLLSIALILYSNILLGQTAFWGGAGSGFMSLNFNGADTCKHVFGGGVASGMISDSYMSTYNCDLYFGDSLSGYNKNIVLSTQNCIFYKGIDGSGYSNIYYDNPATCPSFFASSNGYSGANARSYSEDDGGCYIAVLPIEASPLFAKIIDRKGYLYWYTYLEENNSGFEVQKSFNGIDWDVVGFVDGMGEYVGQLKYEFWDMELRYQNQYYRFVQKDYDGAMTISNIVNLHPSMTSPNINHIVIYPNPVQQGRNISIRSWISYDLNVKISLFNMLGQFVYERTILFNASNELVEIPTTRLPVGNYLLTINDKTGNLLFQQKLIVTPY
ncbi:MAG: T9SS type A sorting domain-containing protein [Saprospiraceae bacterium]|nr:T9SS type A sorting domain-containing protein [Saprospiraceae bacterium]